MRTNRIWIPAALLVLASLSGTGCLLIPQIKDRVVDLVTSGSAVADFAATGEINTLNDTKTINLRDSLDVASVLHNAGIDVTDVKSITLAGVAYRITRADATAGRKIAEGTITIQRQGGAESDLVTNFNANADALTGWITPSLDAAGVTQINNLFADIVTELQGGEPANEIITYHVSGASTPTGVATDFDYQLRLTISIVGKVKTKVLD